MNRKPDQAGASDLGIAALGLWGNASAVSPSGTIFTFATSLGWGPHLAYDNAPIGTSLMIGVRKEEPSRILERTKNPSKNPTPNVNGRPIAIGTLSIIPTWNPQRFVAQLTKNTAAQLVPNTRPSSTRFCRSDDIVPHIES